MKTPYSFFAVVVAIALGAPAIAADEADRVTALFEHLDEGLQPGAAVLVVRDGDVIYSGGFGYANLEDRTPIDADSTFRLGSVSKQFAAMAIMVLADEGKLGYDDPVADYIPELAAYPGVTIRHLLTHTSGIPDYYDSIDLSGDMPTNADIPAVLASMDDSQFAPGEKYEYSNPAYEMLPLIVEKVSGQSFANFSQASRARSGRSRSSFVALSRASRASSSNRCSSTRFRIPGVFSNRFRCRAASSAAGRPGNFATTSW